MHRGLADGVGIALMQVIAFDEAGNFPGGLFMDYLLPTSMKCPSPELGETVTPPPRHSVGAKGIGESATVGSSATVVNSIVDARPVRGRARRHAANPGHRMACHPGPPDPP